MNWRVEFRGSPQTYGEPLGSSAMVLVVSALLTSIGWVRWAIDSILWISAGLVLIVAQADAFDRVRRKVSFLLVVDSDHITWSWSDGRGQSAKIPIAQIGRVTRGWNCAEVLPPPKAGLTSISIETKGGWIEIVPREFFWRSAQLADVLRSRLATDQVRDVASLDSSS